MNTTHFILKEEWRPHVFGGTQLCAGEPRKAHSVQEGPLRGRLELIHSSGVIEYFCYLCLSRGWVVKETALWWCVHKPQISSGES